MSDAETTDSFRISRRRKVKKLAYLCLVIAAIILAWQVYEYIKVRSPRPPAIDVGAFNATMTATSGPTWPSGGPGAVTGLVALAGDPGSIPPPGGANRIRSFQRKAMGFVEQQARYEYRDLASVAVQHYKAVLTARGFTLLGIGGKSRQRQTLIFVKAPLRVIVSLPTDSKKGRMVFIRLTVIFPAAPVQSR